jgi:hypothetical protein
VAHRLPSREIFGSKAAISIPHFELMPRISSYARNAFPQESATWGIFVTMIVFTFLLKDRVASRASALWFGFCRIVERLTGIADHHLPLPASLFLDSRAAG